MDPRELQGKVDCCDLGAGTGNGDGYYVSHCSHEHIEFLLDKLEDSESDGERKS